MKSKYSVIIVVSIALLTGLFASCGKDRWELYYPMTRQSIWIDSVMRENYLWNDELSDEDELTSSYFLNAVSFLAKVKNTNDKMSYVDTVDMKLDEIELPEMIEELAIEIEFSCTWTRCCLDGRLSYG